MGLGEVLVIVIAWWGSAVVVCLILDRARRRQ